MQTITNLLKALEERAIAQRIGIPHDEARMSYPLRSNTVGSFSEFSDIIGDYYNYHFTRCVSHGGTLTRTEATSRAKEILEQEYRRKNGDLVTAYNDSHDGTNGGLRVVLDSVAERLKTESVERYIRDTFDQHVEPHSWRQKVEIINQFIGECGMNLSSSIRADQPERYAQSYTELIRSYVDALRRTSSVFRRL